MSPHKATGNDCYADMGGSSMAGGKVYLDTVEPPRKPRVQQDLCLRDESISFGEWLALIKAPSLMRDDSAGDFERYWATSSCANHLLWLAEVVKVDKRVRVGIACECARLVVHMIPEDEPLPRRALELAEKFARDGLATADLSDVWFNLWNRIYYYDTEYHEWICKRYESDPLVELVQEHIDSKGAPPTIRQYKECPWREAGVAIHDTVGAALHSGASNVPISVRNAFYAEAIRDKNNWVWASPSKDLIKALSKHDHTYLSNWQPPDKCFPLDLTYRPPITEDLTGTPGFWDKIAGQWAHKVVKEPKYAKLRHCDKDGVSIFDEVQAKADHDCVEIIRRHISVDVMREGFAQIKVRV